MRSAAPCAAPARWFISLVSHLVLLGAFGFAQSPPPTAKPAAINTSPAQQAAPPENTAPSTGDASLPAAAAPQDSAQPQAQEAPANDQGNTFVFKKQVEEVVLHASVFDDQRRPVTGLDRSAFSVVEEGQPQTITSFHTEDVPVAIGIVVDNSGSMRDKRDKVNQAVVNLIRASNPQDEVFVVNFSDKPYLDQDFTSNVNLLEAALHQVSSRGSTALYDAIVASAVHLENDPGLQKRVLLVITDGQDNMSAETLQQASHRLQQINGPTVYAVGLLGSGLQENGRDALQQLAHSTGGAAYFPATLDQVDNITRTIAHDIRTQYRIAYKPRKQGSKPSYQSIRVEAHAPGYGPLTVRTREGYYSPESTSLTRAQ
jgi:Ca-activated chloride channel family protein